MKNKFNVKKISLTSVLLCVFSLLCSLLLWVYVTSTEKNDYTETFNGVKVVFDGESIMRESRGLVITSRGVTSVKVSITGDRRTISKLDAADLTAVIDLSSISSSGRYTNSSYKIAFPTGIDSSTLEVTSKIPESITFEVDKLSTKTVPVEGVFNGSVAEGYSAEPLEFEPNSVKISGPQSSIEKVESAWVEVSRQDVDKTLTFESDYVLRDADDNVIDDDDIQLESDTVTVTLPIIVIKEVSLQVNLINGGGATDKNVKLSIEPSTVTLSGDVDVLAGVNNITVATIDLSDIKDSMTESYELNLPNDTQILIGPKRVEVTVELTGLETKAMTCTNISCININENYEVDILNEELSVNIRGSSEALASVADHNIRAVADLKDFGYATGFATVPVKIYIDGSTETGAFGEYNIFINVRVKEAKNG